MWWNGWTIYAWSTMISSALIELNNIDPVMNCNTSSPSLLDVAWSATSGYFNEFPGFHAEHPSTRWLTASWSVGRFWISPINNDISSGVPERNLAAIRQRATRKFNSSAVWALRLRSRAGSYKHWRPSVTQVVHGVAPEHYTRSAPSNGRTIFLTLDLFFRHSVQARETLRRCFVDESIFGYCMNPLSLGRSSRRRLFFDIAGLDEWQALCG